MKQILITILALSLYSCTTNKYVTEETQTDCIHTGTYLSEEGDTISYAVVYNYHNCVVCKGISDYIGEAR